ncbi:MAG: hypothetical protein JWO11_2514 [Nocardioides sp.]|nr:hypothetical protein [Nocardioides sp.]
MTDPRTDSAGFDSDDELRARLRDADPAASLPPADPDRVARLLEDTMSSDPTTESRGTGTHDRSPLTWLVAAAAVLIIAGVGFFGFQSLSGGDNKVPTASTQPTVTELTGGTAAGRCMVPTAEVLANQAVAFEGTVQAISAGVVTLVPGHFYAGAETDLVEVQAPPDELAQLIGAVDFQVGGTYLVSATGGRVSVCGFSGPVTPALQALYAEAFPG